MNSGAHRTCIVVLLLGSAAVSSVPQLAQSSGSTQSHQLENLRHSGDRVMQRRHAWNLLSELSRFDSWWGEGAVFTTSSAIQTRGIRGFARAQSDAANAIGHGATASADIPVLTYTLYNQAAFQHIRQYGLYQQKELQRLRDHGPPDSSMPDRRSVPSFPTQAMVIKTAWWPVAQRGLTPLPVWDAEGNLARKAGNDYLTWQRVVAVDPELMAPAARAVRVDFAGRSFAQARRVRLQDFHQITLDNDLAARLGQDASAAKLAFVVLGRPLRAGDHLVLVAANLATREITDWIWSAFWWHDQPDHGSFSAYRPASLPTPWRNYLMQVAFDDSKPLQADGTPHICFNPWLEARFPDGGHGGGVMSNCLTCHRRASYPPVSFLPVTRGDADAAHDPAYASGQLGLNFNWSLALHSVP